MRRSILARGEVYHVYNRGVDKRAIFLNDSYYSRFYDITRHYLNYDYPYAHLVARRRNVGERQSLALSLERRRWKEPPVELISFNLLPNHFHFQIRQLAEGGITTFMHRLGTSYTNYFNTRDERSGGLFQGPFKSVRIESEGQFLCLNRYIHVNPIPAGLVDHRNLLGWKWSSLPEYLGKRKDKICNTRDILHYFKDAGDYLDFILAKFKESELESLQGLAIDDDFGWFAGVEEQKRRMRRKLVDAFSRG